MKGPIGRPGTDVETGVIVAVRSPLVVTLFENFHKRHERRGRNCKMRFLDGECPIMQNGVTSHSSSRRAAYHGYKEGTLIILVVHDRNRQASPFSTIHFCPTHIIAASSARSC